MAWIAARAALAAKSDALAMADDFAQADAALAESARADDSARDLTDAGSPDEFRQPARALPVGSKVRPVVLVAMADRPAGSVSAGALAPAESSVGLAASDASLAFPAGWVASCLGYQGQAADDFPADDTQDDSPDHTEDAHRRADCQDKAADSSAADNPSCRRIRDGSSR